MAILYSMIGLLLTLTLVYLYLIMPNTTKKAAEEQFYKFLYAHRGFHDNKGDAPENSLLSFKRAVDKGYGMELDVQLTKDNVVIAFHDFTLDRMCGVKGKIEDLTYDEIKNYKLLDSDETIPTFKEVLEAVDKKTPLIVELKVMNPNLVEKLCEEVEKLMADYNGLYCMESFNPDAVEWYKKNRPNVIRGQLSCNFGAYAKGKPQYKAMEYLLMNFKSRPDFVAYDKKGYNNLSRKICRNLFKNLSVAWTIYTQEELDAAKPHFDLFIFEGFEPK